MTGRIGKEVFAVGEIVSPAVRRDERCRYATKQMIATSGLTMFVVFAVGAGIVTGYVLLVHKFLRKAR